MRLQLVAGWAGVGGRSGWLGGICAFPVWLVLVLVPCLVIIVPGDQMACRPVDDG